MRVHCILHEPNVGMGSVEPWVAGRCHELARTRVYEGEELPGPESFDWLVVPGGTMGAYEEKKYPWLVEEKKLLKEAISGGKIVLGLCLGAQLIAEVTGGTVGKNRHKEIGWFPVSMTEHAHSSRVFKALPAQIMAFQWHQDTFSLPPGARSLASSAACPNQAFEIGNAVGVQFHPESTALSIETLVRNYGAELGEGPYIQKAEAIREGFGHLGALEDNMRLLLDTMEKELR